MNATATAPARQRKPRTKPARSIRLTLKPHEGNPGVVRISIGKEVNDYFLTPIPADYGKGFAVEKMGEENPTIYHVNIDADNRTCDCKGYSRWQKCKHVDGIAALVAANQL